MTVKELIEHLEKMPKDWVIWSADKHWADQKLEIKFKLPKADYLGTQIRVYSWVADEKMNRTVPMPVYNGEPFYSVVEPFKYEIVKQAMSKNAGNQVKTAKMLAISRNTLRKILENVYSQEESND